MLGQDLTKRIQKKVNALLILLSHDHVENVPPPQQPLVAQGSRSQVNTQPPFVDLNNPSRMINIDNVDDTTSNS